MKNGEIQHSQDISSQNQKSFSFKPLKVGVKNELKAAKEPQAVINLNRNVSLEALIQNQRCITVAFNTISDLQQENTVLLQQVESLQTYKQET